MQIFSKLSRSVLGLSVGALLLLLTVAAVRSYRDLSVARARQTEVEERIEVSRQEVQLLESRVERLRHDPAMLERLAREHRAMAYENDIVVLLPDAPAPRRVRTTGLAGAQLPLAVPPPAVEEAEPEPPAAVLGTPGTTPPAATLPAD